MRELALQVAAAHAAGKWQECVELHTEYCRRRQHEAEPKNVIPGFDGDHVTSAYNRSALLELGDGRWE